MSNTLLNDEEAKELIDTHVKLARTGLPEIDYDGITNNLFDLFKSQQQAYADTEMKLISKSVSERTHVGEYGDIVIEVGWIDKIMADIRKNRSES